MDTDGRAVYFPSVMGDCIFNRIPLAKPFGRPSSPLFTQNPKQAFNPQEET